MRGHYGEMLRIETLAEIAGMSEASFHRHFKAATAMSPLQYQKSLRLQAARRLLAKGSEANRAAFAVGYESSSQFRREYCRADRKSVVQGKSVPVRPGSRVRRSIKHKNHTSNNKN